MLDSGIEGLGRRILSEAKDVTAPDAGQQIDVVAAALAALVPRRPMKVATVVGARPEFIKAAPVPTALRFEGHREILLFRKRRVFTGRDVAR
jgi:hypothetical protein